MLAIGVNNNAYTVTFAPMITSFGWGRGEAGMAHSLNMLLAGFMTPLVALMLNRYGGRTVLLIGLFISAVGFFLLSTVVSQLWHWVVIWGFLMAVGFAFAGMMPVMVIVTFWFTARRATVLGLVLSGMSVGGVFAPPAFTWLIEHFESWRTAWLAAAGIACVAGVVAFWVRGKPEDLGQQPDGVQQPAHKDTETDHIKASTYRTAEDWGLGEALKTRPIWLGVAISAVSMMCFLMLITNGKLHFLDCGYSDKQAALVLSSMLFGVGCAKFPLGWLGDRIEPRWIILTVLAVMLPAFFGLWRSPSLFLLVGCAFALGFGLGGIIVLIPTVNANYYGRKIFAGLSGVTTPVMTFFAALVPAGAGFIADRLGSYDLAFTILCCALVVGIVCAALLKPPKKQVNGEV